MAKTIEFKDKERAKSQKEGAVAFAKALTENLLRLKKFNAVIKMIDEDSILEISTIDRDSEAKSKLIRRISETVSFTTARNVISGVDEIIFILGTEDLARRRELFPQFNEGLKPLRMDLSVPSIGERPLKRTDLIINQGTVSLTQDVLKEIEEANTYRVEGPTQEKIFNLAKSISDNLGELSDIYSKQGMMFDHHIFLNQTLERDIYGSNFKMDMLGVFGILSQFR